MRGRRRVRRNEQDSILPICGEPRRGGDAADTALVDTDDFHQGAAQGREDRSATCGYCW